MIVICLISFWKNKKCFGDDCINSFDLKMDRFNNCIVCGSANILDLKRYSRAHLCRCNACSFVFARNKPELKELEFYYSNYSYNKDYYVSDVTLKRYQNILKGFEPFRKTNRLLDIGCGNGDFLMAAKEKGWDCTGVEFSPKAVEICKRKGLSVFEGGLKTVSEQLTEYDIITSFEVIEHINTPLEEIGLIRKHLRIGGLLYLTTPNFNSLMRKLLGNRYDAIVYPEHLGYFNPKSLAHLMKVSGLEKIAIKTTGFSFSRFKNGILSRKEDPYTRYSSDERFRIFMESWVVFQALKSLSDWLFSITGSGLTLKAWFIKKS